MDHSTSMSTHLEHHRSVEPQTGGTRAAPGDQSPGTPGLHGHRRTRGV